ncbi:AAA family ATPase [Octadecabacter sp. 1_MG-2023]|uniref:AAA family ATPase n=1 Tax=unclassified Octadecabacter TaxID=196158 RepID=UPI001C092092|nr:MULTISPECIES: AAA family ATPase [unclassified Octadecabacter]MBU2991956.1 AAA family ATPase [Octadecabacter sp. B2R22]MDO6735930.1 AAA family ATPase [Octadecabacter sp. 1_MG-2023]
MVRGRDTKLSAPYLRSICVDEPEEAFPEGYPFDLPWLTPDFELDFHSPVTILMGENGAGKSTLLEAMATLAGFSTTGGGAWTDAGTDTSEGGAIALANRLRAGWLPKMKKGWFLKAQSFAAVSRQTAGGYLSMSHGEGFSNMIGDRMSGQGVYFLDEPEAALSPSRQVELLVFLNEIQESADAQVIMATHSPILMAVPNATLLQITHRSIRPIDLRDTEHFRLTSAFTDDPEGFVQAALIGDERNLY